MSNRPEDAAETPIERALRLKRAALEAKPKAPGGKFDRGKAAAMRTGASKPWMGR